MWFDGYTREDEAEKVAVVWTCKKGEGGGGLGRVEEMRVPGVMKVGRPKRTRRETVESDIEKLGISEELAMDRAGWRRVISKSDP